MTNINQELGDAETSGTSSTEKQSKRQKKRNRKNCETTQNLSLAEKKKLLEQQYMKNIAMNVDRSRPIMDDSADEDMQIDSNLAKTSKENDEMEKMFSRDEEYFNKLLNTDKLTLTDE